MSTIFSSDFLLQNETARRLYQLYVADLPIIDYHNHLPPNEIAADKKFNSITELWLKGDHYKWRAMRTLGVNETFISGKADDWDKFKAWAACVPQLLRNPLFHWSHLELEKTFGINSYLNPETASEIYQQTNSLLQTNGFSTRGLIQQFKVEMLCTTDDPCDHLQHHQKLAESEFKTKVQPGFRPDKVLNINKAQEFRKYIQLLAETSNTNIVDFKDLILALSRRIDFFHENSCRIADHGLEKLPLFKPLSKELEDEFKTFLQNPNIEYYSDSNTLNANILVELSKLYHQKGWVQQFHLGAIRNNNQNYFKLIGADAGTDSIGDFSQAVTLASFLNELDKSKQLTRTIIYNLNPADNEIFATMAGNFNDGSCKGKIQFGAAWWFLDQLDGMEKQINTLSNMGVLSTFVGMLTDSRSFLSFPRHDYFRRMLCNIFGKEMEKGLLPNDEKWIGKILTKICYQNAKEYFNLNI